MPKIAHAKKTESVESGACVDTFDYDYEAACRLIDVCGDETRTTDHRAHYSYDENSNRSVPTFKQVSGAISDATYAEQDCLLGHHGVTYTYTYTAIGELLTKTEGGFNTT